MKLLRILLDLFIPTFFSFLLYSYFEYLKEVEDGYFYLSNKVFYCLVSFLYFIVIFEWYRRGKKPIQQSFFYRNLYILLILLAFTGSIIFLKLFIS